MVTELLFNFNLAELFTQLVYVLSTGDVSFIFLKIFKYIIKKLGMRYIKYYLNKFFKLQTIMNTPIFSILLSRSNENSKTFLNTKHFYSYSVRGLGWHTHPNKKEEDKELKALKASLPCCRMSVRGQPRVPLSCVRTTYNPTHPWPKSFNLSPGSLNIEQLMHDPSSYSRLINTNSAIRTAARRKTELRTH